LGPGTIVCLALEGDNLQYGANPLVVWNGTDALSQRITAATQTGITVVVPIGNGDLAGTGLLPPAVAEDAIVVSGSSTENSVDRDHEQFANFSKSGPRAAVLGRDPNTDNIPHLAAPATNLASGGTGIISVQCNTTNQYVARAGTSASAAELAGVVALLHQVSGSLSPQGARNELEYDAQQLAPATPNGTWDRQWGYGLVDAFKTLDRLVPQAHLGFDVSCYSGDGWAESPDLIPLDWVVFGDSVRVQVRVHNRGGRPAWNYSVEVGAYYFGNSQYQGVFHTFTPKDTLGPGEYATLVTKWYVN